MESQRRALKEIIEKKIFITKDRERIVYPNGAEAAWLFDFRAVMLEADTLSLMSELFWERCEREYPFQIGGLEAAAIAFIAAFVLKSKEKARPAHGFFIRKSRKKSGLLRMIEGVLTDDTIILVDDILNTGKSFIRQVEVLEALGKKVSAVFSILRFRDSSYYSYFHEKGIRIISLFELNDFRGSLGVENLVDKKKEPVPMPFFPQWYWRSETPDYFKVIPKSAPVIDETKIYFGTDDGTFWALNQHDGSAAWKYKTLFGSRKRRTFSSPILYDKAVYFGAYDGNFYALERDTGKRKWVYLEADWIESTPCIAQDMGLIFVGLEFGLWNKRGELVALDAATGRKKWGFPTQGPVSASPAYSENSGAVVSASENTAFGLDACTGKQLWMFRTNGEIKGSFASEEKRGLVCFGSLDSYLYVLKSKTGELVHKLKANEAIYSTPLIHDAFVYVTSLDKNLYCFNLDSGATLWKFGTEGRIFASPEMIGSSIYVGSNDGRLYELDAETGKNTAFFQATERITDKIASNAKTETVFLSTFGNEIYCLRRKKAKEKPAA